MSTALNASPMIKSIDLLRVNLDGMMLDEFEAHGSEVLDTIEELNHYINGGMSKSHNALINAQQLGRKLNLHMARVRDLIHARKSDYALVQTMQSASFSCAPAMPVFGRRSSVIRSLPSADNAASGHRQFLSDDPQGSKSNSVCGGEAKEAEALSHPQSGEASLQAKS